METKRAFLAILISFAILFGYQYLFVGFDQPQPEQEQAETTTQPVTQEGSASPAMVENLPTPVEETRPAAVQPAYERTPETVTIDTDLYTAEISEDGATITSFVLKNHRETNAADSPGMQLIRTDARDGFPLGFAWGSVVPRQLLYTAETKSIEISGGDDVAELKMVATAGNGLTVERIYSFTGDSYLISLSVVVRNAAGNLLQGTPQLALVNRPFVGLDSPASGFLFDGPAALVNDELHEVKPKKLKEGPKTLTGAIEWAGFEGNYFLCAMVPMEGAGTTFTMSSQNELYTSILGGKIDTLEPGGMKQYDYRIFFGPKKQDMLQEIGYSLARAVNFGWFDVIAKPALWLLNMFYSVINNYGIAIILVTVLFKAIFWPISQKGMKSMKNMQKLQPKMVKIKEKYKSDPAKMNQEVMNLYKTYKVNPLGGCLPMVLQIPVFFALYKVLLQSIELRHAPFMLWITDLSAPDRLYLGFDVPYLGGLPVLTLLMGASMFLQQKLTPTTADPTQAKIMMFLPVVFTFMFLNFASGLVLYWFVNNLLSILQQVLINRESKTSAATKQSS